MHAPHDKQRTDHPDQPARTAPKPKSKRGLIAFVLLAAIALAGGAYWWKGGPASKAPSKGKGAVTVQAIPVETAVARAMRSTTDIPSVGSLRSDEAVQIAPEIAGRIAEIRFQEGEPVKQGDVLVRLDDSLAQAELSDFEARYAFQKANFERADALSKGRNITERAFDEARQNVDTSRAGLELSKVRLSKHTIRAPFSGIVGIRLLSAGAFVSVGTAVVNLEKIDTLKLDFKIPEVFLADVQVGQTADVTVDALPGRTFQARIYAIDPLVDVNGRALQVRARLQNNELVLRPGLFARVSVRGRNERDVVVVPESAIVPRAGETFIFRIENGKAVESKVDLGNRRAGNVEITSGLAANATVVTAGHQRLRNGINVEVVQPAPQPRS
jgi:membrane fusion protein (multidrug efflux system)